MIDAARHFQPVDVIKRNLNAMASMKMNVFHWHLADDQGWRIEIKKAS
jgi:hexosaminidase